MTRLAAAAIGILIVNVGLDAQVPAVHQQSPASTAIDPANGLSLDDALARALEREPSLRSSRAQVAVARGLRAQAALRPNPSISFSQQEEPSGTDNQTRVEVQWPLDLFRKRGRVAVADRELDATQQAAADGERQLAARVRIKYGDVVIAARALSITEQLLAATRTQRDLVAGRVEQG